MKKSFTIEAELEILKEGKSFLTKKRIMLLKLVLQKGSINAASKELKMSYQQAWHFIKEINTLSPLPVVTRKRGGASGGGAEITKYGIKLIKEYDEITKMHEQYKELLNKEIWNCFF